MNTQIRKVLLSLIVLIVLEEAGVAQPAVVVNQVGYRPLDPKIALLKEAEAREFSVIDVQTNKPAFKGVIHPVGRRDTQTSDVVFTIDFTALRRPGQYQIWIPDAGIGSTQFRIADDVYREVAERTTESFTFQRCGTAVGNTTIWHHPQCHVRDAYYFDNPQLYRDVQGGWHDAGDYGKFVATGAVSAAFLLYAYDRSPEQFRDGQLMIPESANKIPDILDEVRWELEWLLKMQTADGGVFHKVSTKKWTGEYLPHRDADQRFIFQVSSTATGAFAAVAALGARIFDRWDKPFARSLLRSALQAWDFLSANKRIVPSGGFKNPKGVEGGEYGDDSDEDERFWAAVELYRVTGNGNFHDYVKYHHRNLGGFNHTVGWQHVQNFAYASYLRMPAHLRDVEITGYLVATLSASCDALVQRIEMNPYRYVLLDTEYYWGSNSVALGYAFGLVQAYEVRNDRKYLNAALDQLHFILGRNTFNQTFVTGVGENPVRRPYHQFSMMLGAGAPVPGLVVGGPNKFSNLRGKTISRYPGKCYEDSQKNYFVNEVAINYTAPLTYLASCFLTTEREVIVSPAGGPHE